MEERSNAVVISKLNTSVCFSCDCDSTLKKEGFIPSNFPVEVVVFCCKKDCVK